MMQLHQSGEIEYYCFQTLETAGVIHAAITRRGGVSPSPWASLNLGGTVGDDPGRVSENRHRAFSAIECEMSSLFDVWQVHGDRVVVADAPRPPGQAHIQADAILTDKKGVTLFMRFADCVPVYLFDPVRQAIGLAHAGWQGTIKRTAGLAVQAMADKYGSRPADIVAGIGPSIAAHHYPVGPEVARQVQSAFGEDSHSLLLPVSDNQLDSQVQFDLWEANRLVLQQSGVHQVEISNLCTACHTADWYSHRGEHGSTGRFGALMALCE
jgi:purine-nucleoside/S-methyl-5'-thioadenosine phosphorylase / adenosine deaminase